MRKCFCFFLLSFWLTSYAQERTLGLFAYDSTSYNGYNLFSPNSNRITYLIDNCGELINSWEGVGTPGLGAELLPNGDLFRSSRIAGSFVGGGVGGILEKISWDDEVLWRYRYADANMHQHHDFIVLPNDNIILIAWERISQNAAIQSGRDSSLVPSAGMWPDHVIELRPIGFDSAEIVWEWHFWDHLIQDSDSSKDNFGIVQDHPELIDVNLTSSLALLSDWTHCNSIDYIEEFDQILLSSRHLSEVFVIDHSTTSAEAASHSGGRYGKGGDILYRWGNSSNYTKNNKDPVFLFSPHSARWISATEDEASRIIIFNNGVGRDPVFSSIDVFLPPVDDEGNFTLQMDSIFGPDTSQIAFKASPPESFFDQVMGSIQVLPNDNLLICHSGPGEFFEINMEGEEVWNYINPVGLDRLEQGVFPFANGAFRVTRYATDYSAFEGRDLTPKGPVEINPIIEDCTIIENPVIVATLQPTLLKGVKVFPTLFDSYIEVVNEESRVLELSIFDINGHILKSTIIDQSSAIIDVTNLSSGICFLRLRDIESHNVFYQKLVKQ